MDMVEKVARAIVVSSGLDPDMTYGHEGPEWKLYAHNARAAIEAMRDPTSWMLNEAVQIYEDQRGNVAGFEYWERMINAALEEPEREAGIAALLQGAGDGELRPGV